MNQELETINIEVPEPLEVSLGDIITEQLQVQLNNVVSGGKVTMPLPTVMQSHKIEIYDVPIEGGKSAFSTGGAYVLQQEIEKLANIDVPTKLSDLENDSNFISEDDLESKNFVTESLVGEALQELSDNILTTIVTEFVSNVQLEQKGYLTSDEVNNVIDQKDFVTKTELSNKGLATEKFVEDIVGEINLLLNIINGEDI